MSEVQHLKEENMFVIPVGEERAHLKYHLQGDDVIEYYSTFVPDAARGQGLAKILVDAGMEFAKAENRKVKPTCWYVDKYFEKHPELKDMKV